MRIVHVLEKSRLDTGSVVQLLAAAAGQAARGHQVWVASRPGGDLEASCEALGVGFLALALRHGFDLGSAWRLRPQLRGADIVHVHKGRAHGVALLAAAGLGPRPALIVNRGVLFPLDRFNRWKYRHPRVRAVVCVADAVRSVVIHTAGVAPARAVTIHAGTDVARFDPARADPHRIRAALELATASLLVGTVSARDWKGWREVLAALAELVPAWPGLHGLLVGCEPAQRRREVARTAADLGLGDRLVVLGRRADMPDVLAACDVVVDASWHGTGITGTIREAMALERAVIATDCGGNSELVIHEQNGLLIPPRDHVALVSALDRLLTDPTLRARLGSAARPRVVELFSTDRRLDRLEAVYRAALRSL